MQAATPGPCALDLKTVHLQVLVEPMKSHHVFTNFFVFTQFPEERAARPSGSGRCLAAKVSCFFQSKVCSAGRFRPFRGGQGLCRIVKEGRYSGHCGEATKRCVAKKIAKNRETRGMDL